MALQSPSELSKREAAGIRSFEKGVQLLQTLRHADGPLRLSDLARRAGMTPSAVRGYMVSLVRTGLAAQDATSARYDLGPEALHLGLAALRRTDFLQLAQGTLARLAETSGQTALLAVWGESGPVVVAKTEGLHTSVYEVRIGTRVTLVGTATGRIFTSFLPVSAWRHLVSEPSSVAALQTLGRAVREAGLARTRPAKLPDRHSISVPVFDHVGTLRGALTIIAKEDVLPTQMSEDAEKALREAARDLSARLGHPRERVV